MASNAIKTQGTLVQYLKTPPTTYAAIGEVYSFTGPGGKATPSACSFESTVDTGGSASDPTLFAACRLV
jgi:hypothetical protein